MPATTTMVPDSADDVLSASDRCDRCIGQAYVRVILPKGTDLLFCGHHWHRHEKVLRPQAARIIDNTSKLGAPA